MNEMFPYGGNYYSNYNAVPSYTKSIPTSPGLVFINNIQEIDKYRLLPNSQMIFMDSSQPVFYWVEVNEFGVTKRTPYSFQEIKDESPTLADKYLTKEEFQQWKENYESSFKQQSFTTNSQSNEPNTTVSTAINNNTSTGRNSSKATGSRK